MKIVAVSDVHGLWDEINYPQGDVLVLAGDICRDYTWGNHDIDGTLQYHKDLDELDSFFGKLKKQIGYKAIIMIAGNHDFCFEKHTDAGDKLTNAFYLEDSSVTIDGIKYYGSPWTPWFWDWAFNFPNHNENFFRARAHARKRWEAIPDDTNVLITHGPPEGILDRTSTGLTVGDQYLHERILDLSEKGNLKLHIFGHIHDSYGMEKYYGIQFVNAAQCASHDSIANEPHEIIIEV